MSLCRHDGFSDDVGQIRSYREVPIEAHSPESGTRDETAAHAEEPAHHADKEPDDDEIDWTDVRLRDRK